MSKLAYFGTFVLGGLVGFIGARIYYKKQMAEIQESFEEDIKSVTDEYKDALGKWAEERDPKKDSSEKAKANLNKPDLKTYANKIEKEQYQRPIKGLQKEKIYQITEDTFAYDDEDEYEKISLYSYTDGVLADDAREEMDNAIDIVGNYENLEDFKKGETVYIRNEILGIDYEIVQVENTYDEEVASRPRHISL